jgi:TolA-binding protein
MIFKGLETIMFLNRLWLGAIILVFVSAGGCAYVTEEYEHTIQLQDQLSHAGALEDSRNYAEAAKEYGMIAERHPDSPYYPKAVRKTAMLHIHPDNPHFDLDASMHWFKILSDLPLSQAEQENVRLYIALLERIRDLQYSIYEAGYDAQKLLATSEKQNRKLDERDKQIQQLESELSWTREELRKMKEVDVLLHKSRNKN